MVCGAAETPLGRPGKGQSVPCKKTGASKLWRFAADKIDCTGRIYSPSRSQVRQLESLIVSEAMVGAFPRFFGRKDPLAKRPHFFRQIISSWFFEVFKGELRHFEVWDGTVLPPNKLQWVLMEKFPVSLVGADPVQCCGKLGDWICWDCKIFVSVFCSASILYILGFVIYFAIHSNKTKLKCDLNLHQELSIEKLTNWTYS